MSELDKDYDEGAGELDTRFENSPCVVFRLCVNKDGIEKWTITEEK